MSERIIPLNLTFTGISGGAKSLRIDTPLNYTKYSVLGGTQGLTMSGVTSGETVSLNQLRITEGLLEFSPSEDGLNVKYRLGIAVTDNYPLLKMYLTPLGSGQLALDLGGNYQTSNGGQIIFEITEEAIRSLTLKAPA